MKNFEQEKNIIMIHVYLLFALSYYRDALITLIKAMLSLCRHNAAGEANVLAPALQTHAGKAMSRGQARRGSGARPAGSGFSWPWGVLASAGAGVLRVQWRGTCMRDLVEGVLEPPTRAKATSSSLLPGLWQYIHWISAVQGCSCAQCA